MTDSCIACRFWIRKGTEFGTCQRGQPYPRLQINIRAEPAYDQRQYKVDVSGYHAPVAEWPTTNQADWCGEFQSGDQHD